MYVHGSCRIIFGASIGLYIILYGPYRVAGCYGALIGFVAFLVGFRVFPDGALRGLSDDYRGLQKSLAMLRCKIDPKMPGRENGKLISQSL